MNPIIFYRAKRIHWIKSELRNVVLNFTLDVLIEEEYNVFYYRSNWYLVINRVLNPAHSLTEIEGKLLIPRES